MLRRYLRYFHIHVLSTDQCTYSYRYATKIPTAHVLNSQRCENRLWEPDYVEKYHVCMVLKVFMLVGRGGGVYNNISPRCSITMAYYQYLCWVIKIQKEGQERRTTVLETY